MTVNHVITFTLAKPTSKSGPDINTIDSCGLEFADGRCSRSSIAALFIVVTLLVHNLCCNLMPICESGVESQVGAHSLQPIIILGSVTHCWDWEL